MPRYIISLGSNLPEGDTEVEEAIKWLAGIFSLISTTPTYNTPDAHDQSKPRYTNAIATITCDLDAAELTKRLKSYEISRGRKPGTGSVPIDLDLVCRDNEILRPRDFSAPYFLEGLYLLSTSGRFNK